MENCIFCKIVRKKVPAIIVYEDKDFMAFLSIEPLNLGHTLVIPKKHHRWVWDMPDIGKYYEVIGKIANALRKAFETEWVVSVVFGEEIPHAHVWLVPRFPDDGHGGSLNTANVKTFSNKEMEEAAEKIRELL
jgi:histidine triad (HIT) family protein